jgi:hypothetical protein
MDLTKSISELRLEREQKGDAIRSLKRPNRFAARTTRAGSPSVIEIRNPSTTTNSEQCRNEQALAHLNRFAPLIDPPPRRVIEIRPARNPEDAA